MVVLLLLLLLLATDNSFTIALVVAFLAVALVVLTTGWVLSLSAMVGSLVGRALVACAGDGVVTSVSTAVATACPVSF